MTTWLRVIFACALLALLARPIYGVSDRNRAGTPFAGDMDGNPITDTSDSRVDIHQTADLSSGNFLTVDQADADQELTASSGEQAMMVVDTEIAQSGTAGYIVLLVDRTETSAGSGTQELLALRAGGTDKFTVADDGGVSLHDGKLYLRPADTDTHIWSTGFDDKIRFTVGGTTVQLELAATVPIFNGVKKYTYASDISAGSAFLFDQYSTAYELTAAAGEQAVFEIGGEINQSGTAGYVGLLVDVTESAAGSGTQELLALRQGGVDKFTVSDTGIVTSASYMIVSGDDVYLRSTSDGQIGFDPTNGIELRGKTSTAASATVFVNGDLSAAGAAALAINQAAASFEFTGISGVQAGIENKVEIDQGGTAAFMGHYIGVSDTGSGSGQDYLIFAEWDWDQTNPLFAVEDDGDVTMAGALTVGTYTRTVSIEAGDASVGASAPTVQSIVDSGGITVARALGFDSTAGEEALLSTCVPSDWDGSSDWTLRMVWTNQNGNAFADTEDVDWYARWRTVTAGEATEGAAVTSAMNTYTQSGAGTDSEIFHTDLTIDHDDATNPLTAGDCLLVNIQRNVGGTESNSYSGEAAVIRWLFRFSSTTIPKT